MTSWRRGRFKGKEYVLSRLMRFIKNDELNAINLTPTMVKKVAE
jgi:hypothetical protein